LKKDFAETFVTTNQNWHKMFPRKQTFSFSQIPFFTYGMLNISTLYSFTDSSGHLISQGTADIILDACADLWTGNDLEQLTDDVSPVLL